MNVKTMGFFIITNSCELGTKIMCMVSDKNVYFEVSKPWNSLFVYIVILYYNFTSSALYYCTT